MFNVSLLSKSVRDYFYPPKRATDVVEISPFQQHVLQTITQLKKDISNLKSGIQKIDAFVHSHPELLGRVEEAFKRYEPLYNKLSKPETRDLDPQKPIDLMTLLSFQKNDLEAQLSERRRFLDHNPSIQRCFEKYLIEEQQRTNETQPYLLEDQRSET